MFFGRKIIYFVIVIVLGAFVSCFMFHVPCYAQEAKPVEVYIFHMTGCPHCGTALKFLGGLVKKYPTLTIKEFNLSKSGEEIIDLYFALGDVYKLDVARGPTPVIYLGDESWDGYDNSVGIQLEQKLVKCIAQGCPSPLDKLEKSDQKDGAGILTGGNTWLAWPILVVVLGVIVFVVIKITRSNEKT
jgi:glutaredoxin